MPLRLGGYWVTALSLTAQAWPASNEAPRPVTQPGALIALLWVFCFLSWGENFVYGGTIEEPCSDTQRANRIASCPYSGDPLPAQWHQPERRASGDQRESSCGVLGKIFRAQGALYG